MGRLLHWNMLCKVVSHTPALKAVIHCIAEAEAEAEVGARSGQLCHLRPAFLDKLPLCLCVADASN